MGSWVYEFLMLKVSLCVYVRFYEKRVSYVYWIFKVVMFSVVLFVVLGEGRRRGGIRG